MCTGVDWFSIPKDEYETYKPVAVYADPSDTSNPLVVIHAKYDGDLLPGKLDVNTWQATVPYNEKARVVDDFQVACASADTVLWVADVNGHVPRNAIIGGKMKCSGENLFIGRAEYEGAIIPGKVHPSEKACFITYNDSEIRVTEYDVLCKRGGCGN